MSWTKFHLAIIFVLALSAAAGASITEIRQDFFNQAADLPPTPILSAPAADASYLIAVYEGVGAVTITPTLRWIDENGNAQSQTGTIAYNGYQVTAFIRVKAGTQPTVETTGYSGTATYNLYVTGFGFWSSGAQGQAGLSELTGTAHDTKRIYFAPHSVSAFLVAFSLSRGGEQYITWYDENGERIASITPGAPVITPMRIAGGTEVLAFDPIKAGVWYGLIFFGAPAAGDGPLNNYESYLLNWTDATFPQRETIFNPGTSGRNVALVMANIAQRPNNGNESEELITNDPTPTPCGHGIIATASGVPTTCVVPANVAANTALQFWTINTPGSPWGVSPEYSAEVDVLQF